MRSSFTTTAVLVATLLLSVHTAFSQERSTAVETDSGATGSDAGALQFHFGGGWSFGLPGAMACIASQCSPERTTLLAPSMQVALKAGRGVVVFADVTAFDSGVASATYRNQSVEVSGSDTGLSGGVRIMTAGGDGSDLRGYVEASGGVLHETLTSKFNGQPMSGSFDAKMFMFGAGFERLVTPRGGVSFGVDIGHVGGRTFTRIRSAWVFQTKRAFTPDSAR